MSKEFKQLVPKLETCRKLDELGLCADSALVHVVVEYPKSTFTGTCKRGIAHLQATSEAIIAQNWPSI